MAEKIMVYKCPFFDECENGGTTYYDTNTGEPYITFPHPECKGALFEDENGDAVCAITEDNPAHYKDAIKEVQRKYLRRPSMITKLKNWIREKGGIKC